VKAETPNSSRPVKQRESFIALHSFSLGFEFKWQKAAGKRFDSPNRRLITGYDDNYRRGAKVTETEGDGRNESSTLAKLEYDDCRI
jgi:hypothetical protein